MPNDEDALLRAHMDVHEEMPKDEKEPMAQEDDSECEVYAISSDDESSRTDEDGPDDVVSEAVDAPMAEPAEHITARISRELHGVHELICSIDCLPEDVHEGLLSRSWGLLDMAAQFADSRDVAFGENLIDARDALMEDVQSAMRELMLTRHG